MIRKQQQPYERMAQFAQSHSPQRQHPPPSAPVTQSVVSDAADSRQQNILQMQYNLALLSMNAMNLPPHQHQELLKLQLQLNHLQQLSLKQHMKTQQLEQEAKPASPGMNPVKSSTRLDLYSHRNIKFDLISCTDCTPAVPVPCSLSPGLCPHLVSRHKSPTKTHSHRAFLMLPIRTQRKLMCPR
jgi:hypothetical protein